MSITIKLPHPPGTGGPGSFQQRFENELLGSGYKVAYKDSCKKPDLIFVVGGTRHIFWLIRMKFKGVPILFRLDGILWLHRKKKARRGVISFFNAEIINLLSKILHAFIADFIVYQSEFVKNWWDKEGLRKRMSFEVIYNGVDLEEFKPRHCVNEPISILCVEGNLDYTPYAIELLNQMQARLATQANFQSLIVYGGFGKPENRRQLNKKIDFRGVVKKKDLPDVYKNAVYLSLDVNAACPNTVIEALASGIPVIGFDTGALPELVSQKSGAIVPFGGNPWNLDFPDVESLMAAASLINKNYMEFALQARLEAERNFNIKYIASRYIGIIEKLLVKKKRPLHES